MKPLILQYFENPTLLSADQSMVEYSTEKNLSVLTGTDIPAIICGTLDTETATKTAVESTDSDKDIMFQTMLETETYSFDDLESTDRDDDRKRFVHLLDTETLTEQVEETDADR